MINLEPIGGVNRYCNPANVAAELTIVQDIREVVHDGYCSDPGEDTGEWNHDKVTVYQLDDHQYQTLLPYCDQNGKIPQNILQKIFPTEIPCGYCGYNSDYVTKEGTLVYVKDVRRKKEIELRAYFMAEKDNFAKSPEHYWLQAEDYQKRKDLLQQKLAEKGLVLRGDSKLCQKYINNELLSTDKYYTVDDVVRCMVECKWCLEYSDMRHKIMLYKDLFESQDPYEKMFSTVKEIILKDKPVPQILPWPHPIPY